MNPIIRLAGENDKAEVLSLLNSVFSENQRTSALRDEDYWNWKFMDNPFGQSLLFVAEKDGRIIGVDNWWPWEFNLRGHLIKALEPCDSAVLKEYRGEGCFKLLRMYGLKIVQSQETRLLFNYPNSHSLALSLSLGWHFQNQIPWMIRVLKPFKIVRGIFSGSQTISVPVDESFRLDVEVLNRLSQEQVSLDHFLKINRVPGFHEWRYLDHPYRHYGMVQYQMRKKVTAAVFTINKRGKNREMVVVDIIGSVGNTIPLFKLVTEAAKKMDVSFIAVMDNPCFNTSELWRLGFFQKKFKNMVVLPLDLSLENIVKGYSNWSLMAGLHDSI